MRRIQFHIEFTGAASVHESTLVMHADGATDTSETPALPDVRTSSGRRDGVALLPFGRSAAGRFGRRSAAERKRAPFVAGQVMGMAQSLLDVVQLVPDDVEPNSVGRRGISHSAAQFVVVFVTGIGIDDHFSMIFVVTRLGRGRVVAGQR